MLNAAFSDADDASDVRPTAYEKSALGPRLFYHDQSVCVNEHEHPAVAESALSSSGP